MDQILGQERAVGLLQAALDRGKVHHAYVFHGPAGVGKCTAALAFARVILCHQPRPASAGQARRLSACGECDSCRLLQRPTPAAPQSDEGDAQPIASGPTAPGPPPHSSPNNPQSAIRNPQSSGHPDLHVVTKELARYSNDKQIRERKLMTIPVDVINDHVLEPVYRSAQLRHGKVFIIDEAELIDDRTAQGKLLKTFEEPPAGTVLILVTSQEHRLLPTLRSRCQRIGFLPLPEKVILGWLKREDPRLSDLDRKLLVDFADGSLGRAMLARRYGLSSWARDVLPALDELRRGQFPVALGRTLARLIDELALRWVEDHDNASKEAANKMAAGLMWSLIGQHLRRRLAEAAEAAKGRDAIAAGTLARPWIGMLEAVTATERDLAANVNLGLVCDHVVAAMA